MTEQTTTPDPAPAACGCEPDTQVSTGSTCNPCMQRIVNEQVEQYIHAEALSGLLRGMARRVGKRRVAFAALRQHMIRVGGKVEHERDEARAELARALPVVDAARAYAADETSSETLYSRLVDAVAALDVDAAATPQPANDIAPTAGPSVDVTAEIAWHVTQLRRDGAAPVDGSAHYDEGWRNAYEQAANDMEARAEQRALATPTTEETADVRDR